MIRRVFQVSIDCFGKTPVSQVYIRRILKRYKNNIFSDPRVHPLTSVWNR